jgi:hypothetical protein
MHLLIPPWFYGFDSAMYFVSAMIGFLISYNAYRLYSITNKKQHFYLHIGFLLLSLGLLVATTANEYSYLNLEFCHTNCELGLFDLNFGIEDIGYFLYFGLSIVGYTLLASAYFSDKTKMPIIVLLALFAFTAILISGGIPRNELLVWYVYHQYFNMLAFLIVGYIFFRVSANFSESKNTNSLLVAAGYFGILFFHILHFFSYFDPTTYALAHLFLIGGYLSLLAMLLRVRH